MEKLNGDLISRSELYGIESLLMTDVVENDPVAKFVLDQVLHDIQSVPSVEAEPVVHAHWICDCEPYHICSNCRHKFSLFDRIPRCPNCGAHMDEEVV